MVISTIVRTINYFEGLEERLRRQTGLNEKDFKDRIGNILQKAPELYKQGKVTGLTNVDEFVGAVKGNQETQKEYTSRGLSQVSYNYIQGLYEDPKFIKAVKAEYKKAGPKALSNTTAKFKQKSVLVITFLEDYLNELLGSGNLPSDQLEQILNYALNKKMDSTSSGYDKAKKLVKKLTEEE
jgi:hypothetical protein